MSPAAEATRAPPLARLQRAGRLLVLLALLGGLVAAWLNRGALDPHALSGAIARYPAAPLLFLLAQVVASLLFIPRTIFALAAGLLFGLAGGLLWTTLGGVLGGLAGFLVARYLNAGLIEPETIPRLGPLLLRCEAGGWRAVMAVRLVPIVPHSLANYALGLTRLGIGSFALGSLLGQLPMTVAYVDFGAAGGELMQGKAGWLLPTLVGAGALLLSFAAPRLLARVSLWPRRGAE
jgi:uncharacterized membrane protein YdjX (TVP38/TMEM64 family)